jgi:hypothetical protein
MTAWEILEQSAVALAEPPVVALVEPPVAARAVHVRARARSVRNRIASRRRALRRVATVDTLAHMQAR